MVPIQLITIEGVLTYCGYDNRVPLLDESHGGILNTYIDNNVLLVNRHISEKKELYTLMESPSNIKRIKKYATINDERLISDERKVTPLILSVPDENDIIAKLTSNDEADYIVGLLRVYEQ